MTDVVSRSQSVGLDPAVNANANRTSSAYEVRPRSPLALRASAPCPDAILPPQPRARTPTAQHPHGHPRSRSGTRTPVPHPSHAGTPAPHHSPAHGHHSRQPTLSPDPLDLGDYDPSWLHDPAAPYDRNLDDPEFDLDDLLDGWSYDN